MELSRRQQVLYDEFLTHREARLEGKKTDYLGLMNVLMQLRKVCNHPDLIEARQVRSPFVMSLGDIPSSSEWIEKKFNFNLNSHPYHRLEGPLGVSSLCALSLLHHEFNSGRYQINRANELKPVLVTLGGGEISVSGKVGIDSRPLISRFRPVVEKLLTRDHSNQYLENEYIASHQPAVGNGLFSRFTKIESEFDFRHPLIGLDEIRVCRTAVDCTLSLPAGLVMSEPERLESVWSVLSQVAAYTVPVIVSPWTSRNVVGGSDRDLKFFLRESGCRDADIVSVGAAKQVYHRIESGRLCGFPDRRFLEWDCGKFRTLKSLLIRLRSGGHKVVLFTQMSKMLDVIEAFANLGGFTYVRLDGATKVADRQVIVDRFNRDKKLFLFISSTRAGGVGINLTGADTVVFFDSDWNPAMDKQAMDRCHRIGQVRDVNIYRLVSEKTIEENIFIKQLQKRKLDEVVLDRGAFHQMGPDGEKSSGSGNGGIPKGIEDLLDGLFETKKERNDEIYGTKVLWEREELEDEAGGKKQILKEELEMEKIMAQVEDVEDVSALTVALKEQSTVPADDVADQDTPTEDPNYEALPAIVRRSVGFVEQLLRAEHRGLQDSDESEWEELENAQWSSEDEDDEEADDSSPDPKRKRQM